MLRGPLAESMFVLVFLLALCPAWVLVLRQRFWQRLRLGRIRLEGVVHVGGGPLRPKVAHCVRVKPADGRSVESTPRARLQGGAWGGTLEHGRAFHRRALERWHQSHGVLVNGACLHAAVTGEPGATSPLQLGDSFMSHFVKRFVKQTIPEQESRRDAVRIEARESGLNIYLLTGESDISAPRSTCCSRL